MTMRVRSLLALGLLAGVPLGAPLAAQDPRPVPPPPEFPSLPDVTLPLGPNVREYVAYGCASGVQVADPPGSRNLTPRFVPQCTAARLVYSWTETVGSFTLYLKSALHPWVDLSRYRSEDFNPPDLRMTLGFVGESRAVPYSLFWRGSTGGIGVSDDGFAYMTRTTGALTASSFLPRVLDFAAVTPTSTQLGFRFGVDNTGLPASTALQLQFTAVPEPSTYALLGTGLLTLGTIAARRRKRAEA